MGAAAEGKKVAVVTIDPARRLANSLGLEELGNEPHLVDSKLFEAAGLPMKGELWAMMLDPKRTFDEVIEQLAPDEKTRDEVLDNRIYKQLSSAVAGSQEYTAIAKLYELDREHDFDLLVLDTPPSRNALDFLDAPDRLTQFFEGRALQVFLRPTGLAARVMGRGTGMVFGVLKRVTGVDLLEDLAVFFRAIGGMIDGCKAGPRARAGPARAPRARRAPAGARACGRRRRRPPRPPGPSRGGPRGRRARPAPTGPTPGGRPRLSSGSGRRWQIARDPDAAG